MVPATFMSSGQNHWAFGNQSSGAVRMFGFSRPSRDQVQFLFGQLVANVLRVEVEAMLRSYFG